MTTHSDEIMFLNRLVEDLKEMLKPVLSGSAHWIREHGIDMDRLNQAMEVIARLEKCKGAGRVRAGTVTINRKTGETVDDSELPTLEQVQNIYKQDQ